MRFALGLWLLAAPLATHAQTNVSSERLDLFFSGQAALEFSPSENAPPVAPAERGAAPKARRLSYTIVKTYPHDTAAFTEGLFWHDGFLYESIGIEGQSQVRKVDLNSGKVVQAAVSPDKVFGEGLARIGRRLIQLTYTEGRALVYDFDALRLTGEHHYTGEGWGLTTDGASLIMSDGGDALIFRDPDTFAPRRRLRVAMDGRPVKNLNELEFADGHIWANIWKSERIVRIDPASGRVTGFLDMTGLLRPGVKLAEPEEDVLNGIAYDPKSGHFFVTGKCWPSLFEIAIGD